MADIRKRTGKNGVRYQVRYPSKASPTGYAYASFLTIKEARTFREDAAARERSRCVASGITSIAEGVAKWLDVCEKEGRDGRDPVTSATLRDYKYRAEFIKRYPWAKPLPELSAPDVVAFRSWLLQQLSREMAHKVLSSFHSMVLELVRRGHVAHDFAAGISVGGHSRYDSSVNIPTERDIGALLTAADKLANSRNQQIARSWLRYRPMLYLAVDTGMRPQEYVAAAQSSLAHDGIRVERALDRSGRHLSVTKTRAGRRFINLSSETVSLVRHYIENHAATNSFDLIFPTATGQWQSLDNWRKRGFGVACQEAGLVETIEVGGKRIVRPKHKPYDLRHFYASMLIEQRVNLKRLQMLMGHQDIQTTLNVYGHIIERVEASQGDQPHLISALRRE